MTEIEQLKAEIKNIIHLQGIGKVKAKPIKDFNVGEKFLYNYGYKAEILEKEIKGKSVKLKIKTDEGNTYDQIKRADTLWGIG